MLKYYILTNETNMYIYTTFCSYSTSSRDIKLMSPMACTFVLTTATDLQPISGQQYWTNWPTFQSTCVNCVRKTSFKKELLPFMKSKGWFPFLIPYSFLVLSFLLNYQPYSGHVQQYMFNLSFARSLKKIICKAPYQYKVFYIVVIDYLFILYSSWPC